MSQQTMAVRDGVPRSIRRPASALGIGLSLAVFAVVVHAVGGSFANDWEGWGTALQNASFATVSGALFIALTFGVLVRNGRRTRSPERNRPARAALVAGVIAILSYVIFFTGAPAIVGAGAITLGLEGLRLARDGKPGRAPALAGLALGTASVAIALAFYAAETASGVLEHWT